MSGADVVSCPVCGTGELEPFLLLEDVPVLSTEFHDDRESALDVTRGDLDLAVCPTCALVWNRAFEPALVDYTPDYENSQHFSPAFQGYVEDLARRLDADHGLRGATVVDIGCGKGEFLAVLARAVDARGIGFDPTFDGEVDDERIEVVRRFYDQETAGEVDADLVMARHVVEHLADPVGFLHDVREASGPGAAFYYEVPNAEYVFSDDGMWDLIYQHVGYFARPTLDLALRASGHRVLAVQQVFHDQFLGIDAVPADDAEATVAMPPADVVDVAVERIGDLRHPSPRAPRDLGPPAGPGPDRRGRAVGRRRQGRRAAQPVGRPRCRRPRGRRQPAQGRPPRPRDRPRRVHPRRPRRALAGPRPGHEPGLRRRDSRGTRQPGRRGRDVDRLGLFRGYRP